MATVFGYLIVAIIAGFVLVIALAGVAFMLVLALGIIAGGIAGVRRLTGLDK